MEGWKFYNLIHKLGKINLTPHESQALLCLIFKLQEAEAQEILKHTSIPKSKIYDVLESLCEKELIIKNPTAYPPKYQKHPNLDKSLDKLYELLITEIEHEKEELRRATNYLIAHLVYKAYGTVVVPTIKEATKNTVRMCMEAEKGDEIMISTRTFDWIEEAKFQEKSLFDILSEKINDGVKIRVLLADPESLKGEMREIATNNFEKLKKIGAEVGLYDRDIIRMTIAGNRCQFILWYYPWPGPDEKSISPYDIQAPCDIYYSENKFIVEQFKQLFNYHFLQWKIKEKSKSDEKFKELVEELKRVEIFRELF